MSWPSAIGYWRLTIGHGPPRPMTDFPAILRLPCPGECGRGMLSFIHINGYIYMSRIFNFSAGPATLPLEVLEKARDELTNWHGSGMSVMEMSHRGKEYMSIQADAEADLRELMGIRPTTRCCSCRAARRCSSPWFR